MAKWFYYNEQGEKIEVTGGQLKGLAKTGRITPGTMIETEDGKAAPARRVKGLTFAATPQSKPIQETKTPPREKATTLHEAVKQNDVQRVVELIESKADINAKDADGWTPLHLAITDAYVTKKLDKVVALVKAGADVNAKDKRGETCLERAKAYEILFEMPGLVAALTGAPTPSPRGASNLSGAFGTAMAAVDAKDKKGATNDTPYYRHPTSSSSATKNSFTEAEQMRDTIQRLGGKNAPSAPLSSNSSDVVFRLEGINGQLKVYSDRIVLVGNGGFVSAPNLTVYYQHMGNVKVVLSAFGIRGNITFFAPGEVVDNGWLPSTNSLIFTGKGNEQALKIHEFVQNKLLEIQGNRFTRVPPFELPVTQILLGGLIAAIVAGVALANFLGGLF